MLVLQYIPLNNVVSIFQTCPLVVTSWVGRLLRREVGWRRWWAITTVSPGTAHIRPGFKGFNAFSMLVLASVFFC